MKQTAKLCDHDDGRDRVVGRAALVGALLCLLLIVGVIVVGLVRGGRS